MPGSGKGELDGCDAFIKTLRCLDRRSLIQKGVCARIWILLTRLFEAVTCPLGNPSFGAYSSATSDVPVPVS